jgi:hypothetical protein
MEMLITFWEKVTQKSREKSHQLWIKIILPFFYKYGKINRNGLAQPFLKVVCVTFSQKVMVWLNLGLFHERLFL